MRERICERHSKKELNEHGESWTIRFRSGDDPDIGTAVDELEVQICGFVYRTCIVSERGVYCDLIDKYACLPSGAIAIGADMGLASR
jgi:hypothetical protein